MNVSVDFEGEKISFWLMQNFISFLSNLGSMNRQVTDDIIKIKQEQIKKIIESQNLKIKVFAYLWISIIKVKIQAELIMLDVVKTNCNFKVNTKIEFGSTKAEVILYI